MASTHYPYVIVGGGLTGASAIEGIRSRDKESPILVLARENHPPYHRPPLSKGLWFGKETRDKLPVHPDDFYRENKVELFLRREAVELDPAKHVVWDDRGTEIGYGKLLLATGGRPRMLDAEGADTEGVHYYRYLEDYLMLESKLPHFQHALVVGGGFIGLELAAALRHKGKDVTLLYPQEYPLRRVLPRELGLYVADYYREKGVETVSGESVAALAARGGEIVATTHNSNSVTTEMVLVGVGIEPTTDLADAAGLQVGNGIEVDEYARTSEPDIYAAGDVAEFPYLALDVRTRVEHWDHAIQHGRAAGANMAGANHPYTTLPMFYSDFFDLGWEAVGDLDPGLVVEPVWKEPFRQGVLFYLRDDVVRGVLLWNSWGMVDWVRELIRKAKPMTSAERAAVIPSEG
ncbi:MAG TPA: FAD-dependent oxidoreductase [Candidatus Eisenbacteria bacterium]|jgi:NADPH-dependent 2,4-dienoyl-CoA reductase/sulfur reductase-like enzyme